VAAKLSTKKMLDLLAVGLNRKKRNRFEVFSRGTFPNHLVSIRDGKFNPKTKAFHEFDDIAINKTAKIVL
jgi:hypothetical protein